MLAGAYRLRLPLPWPGVPHVNAWAIRSGDGFVLFDTGLHTDSSIDDLDIALQMCGLQLQDATLLVCTHAHSDHYGQARDILERAGCELWMHPRHEHEISMLTDRSAQIERRLQMARDAGAPAEQLRDFRTRLHSVGLGLSAVAHPDRPLLDGVRIATDLGDWVAYETPGHAPSHVCLFQPERRLLISGDHVLGRISLHFDYGHTPDPIAEYLRSLDVVQALDARLCLAGHGRTFTDVRAHIDGSRALVRERLDATLSALAAGPLTGYQTMGKLFQAQLSDFVGPFALYETLASLRHLQVTGAVSEVPGQPLRWMAD